MPVPGRARRAYCPSPRRRGRSKEITGMRVVVRRWARRPAREPSFDRDVATRAISSAAQPLITPGGWRPWPVPPAGSSSSGASSWRAGTTSRRSSSWVRACARWRAAGTRSRRARANGQFYDRMALSPLNFDHTAHGITMDTFSRFERIAYPTFSWLVAGGQTSAVPWSLVVVNVIGLACLGGLGAVIARMGGFVVGFCPRVFRIRVGCPATWGDRDGDLRRGRRGRAPAQPSGRGRRRLQRGRAQS